MKIKYKEQIKNKDLTTFQAEKPKMTENNQPVATQKPIATYDPHGAIQQKDTPMLPPDSILDGVITQIQNGIVDTFVKGDKTKWKNLQSPAINCMIEVSIGDGKIVQIDEMFTYEFEEGHTIYRPKMKIGKYQAKYGTLPMVGQKVKILTTNEGYGSIKLT